jgi:hypothetical protein
VNWIPAVSILALGIGGLWIISRARGFGEWRRAAGDVIELLLEAGSRRASGLYHGFRSFRIGYQSEVEARRLRTVVRQERD